MKTIQVNSHGSPIAVEVKSGHAQIGSYELRLWAANENRILLRAEGNFINPQDDSYVLPGTPGENHGRVPQAVVALALTPPETRYQVDLIVRQDGAEVGRETVSGVSTEPSVILNIFLTLAAQEN